MTKHYHVHAGLHGCLPSYSATHDSYLQARNDMDDFTERCAEAAAQVGWKGPLFDSFDYPEYLLALDAAVAGVEYAEVVECQEVDCSEEG